MGQKLGNKTRITVAPFKLGKDVLKACMSQVLSNNANSPVILNEDNLQELFKLSDFKDFNLFTNCLKAIALDDDFTLSTNENGDKELTLKLPTHRQSRKGADFNELVNTLHDLYK